MKTKSLLSAIMLCLVSLVSAQHTIHVPGDQPTIQAGIDAANDGDIVLVDTGTYFENINFNGKAITVKSHYDPENPDSSYIKSTKIDGSQPENPDEASVVTMKNGADTNFVIQGFTIQNGNGTKNGIIRCGGGINCYGGGKIINNIIIDNTVDNNEWASGGGIYANGYASSNYIITDNIIKNNHLHNYSNNHFAYGCGIMAYGVHLIIENNVIKSNSADGRPYGVGLFLERCHGTVKNNTIIDNTGNSTAGGRSRGGGIYIVNHHPGLTISNNTISNNNVDQTLWGYGGGIQVLNTGGYGDNDIRIDGNIIRDNSSRSGGGVSITDVHNITISNNVIKSNEVERYGGGILLEDYSKEAGDECIGIGASINSGDMLKISGSFLPVFVNNTIISNLAEFYGGGINSFMIDKEFIAFNNIIYGNDAGNGGEEIYLNSNCLANLQYNDVDSTKIAGSGTWSGGDNIFCDPDFIDDSCHIPSWSLCVDAGKDSVEIPGTFYYAPDRDFEDEPRPNTGCTLVDIGADESIYCPHFNAIPDPEKDQTILSLRTHPNPFTTSTTLSYTLDKPSTVTISIFNPQGQLIEKIEQEQQKGEQQVQWNAEGLPSGIYYFRFQAGDMVGGGKMVLMR